MESGNIHHHIDGRWCSNLQEALLRSLFFVSICAIFVLEILSITKGMGTRSAPSFGDQFRRALCESASNG